MDRKRKAFALFILTTIAGCSQYSPDPRTHPSALPRTTDSATFPIRERIKAMRGPDVTVAQCLAAIDSIDGIAVTKTPYSANEYIRVMGWAIAPGSPRTPEPIRAALLPYKASNVGIFVKGERMHRPDVAGGDVSLINAGYDLRGHMPAHAGYYRIVLVMGTGKSAIACDTGTVVTVHE